MSELSSPLSLDAAPTPDVALGIRRMAPIVTVIGEPILDGWWHGRSDRIAREAPAPVVSVGDHVFVPGGAANTARNLAELGAQVRFVGAAGDDEAGRRLRDLLAADGIDVTHLLLRDDVTTITKTRVVVADQVLLRLDEGVDEEWTSDALDAVRDAALAATDGADAEVVCDYGCGMLSFRVRDALASRDARPALTVVDAHDPVFWAPLRPDIVTPNSEETAALLHRPLKRGSDRAGSVAAHAEELLATTNSRDAVVTLDRDGTLVLCGDGKVHRTWARPASEKQASGAGDTFVAALTIARACGLPLTTSADFAQAAADVVVGRAGTSVCSTADIIAQLARSAENALDEDELIRRLKDERAAGRRIVFTNGCFDVLHRGHTAYLNQAKRLGDILVVAINSDDSVRRLKGESRPINHAGDRAGVLAALSSVDYVTVFDTDTPIPLLERIAPDIYAKGGDYSAETLAETPVVLAAGGEVRILDFLPEHSTTAIVERIRVGDLPGPHPGGAST
ncbi:D-glycero-beta-D-manno-heptose 1-phosphate adenylyltransferase [Herbiconiux sp. L3-i23]|uniref:D-glycero-beta-D-manno-heptose 1-phosphate adenylyltransferase n=1 Tax=Herbiconiux sp. L3-i23 TaxID=2905871 RepID=UPI0020584D34|nr:D-glycero-beta-D-manno-heptose 1-phosphate adenylyltransferase [Herbiconiux sp. L3-i23]BDI23325.1 bifunctional protein HldE [Herbiconiux sp. L3-i23]